MKKVSKTNGVGALMGAALAATGLTQQFASQQVQASNIVPAVNYGTVTYTLSINDDGTGTYASPHYCAGAYAVYASDTTNNGGLCSFEVNVGGYTTINNMAPEALDSSGTYSPIGFSFNRANTPPEGSQDTTDALKGETTILMVYGIGQTAGNLASVLVNAGGSVYANGKHVTQPVYGAPVELITGTFTSGKPSFTATGSDTGNVFLSTAGATTQAPTIAFATQTLGTGNPHSALLTVTTTGTPSPAYLGTSNPAGTSNSSTINLTHTGTGYYVPGLLNSITTNATNGAAAITGFANNDPEIIAVAFTVADAGNAALHTPSTQELTDIITDLNASPSLPSGVSATVETFSALQTANPAAASLLSIVNSNDAGQTLELAVLLSGTNLTNPQTFGLNFTSETVDGITQVSVSDIAVVPEPASMSMLLLGGLPLLHRRRRKVTA